MMDMKRILDAISISMFIAVGYMLAEVMDKENFTATQVVCVFMVATLISAAVQWID